MGNTEKGEERKGGGGKLNGAGRFRGGKEIPSYRGFLWREMGEEKKKETGVLSPRVYCLGKEKREAIHPFTFLGGGARVDRRGRRGGREKESHGAVRT